MAWSWRSARGGALPEPRFPRRAASLARGTGEAAPGLGSSPWAGEVGHWGGSLCSERWPCPEASGGRGLPGWPRRMGRAALRVPVPAGCKPRSPLLLVPAAPGGAALSSADPRGCERGFLLSHLCTPGARFVSPGVTEPAARPCGEAPGRASSGGTFPSARPRPDPALSGGCAGSAAGAGPSFCRALCAGPKRPRWQRCPRLSGFMGQQRITFEAATQVRLRCRLFIDARARSLAEG